jgi:hypothetical protein
LGKVPVKSLPLLAGPFSSFLTFSILEGGIVPFSVPNEVFNIYSWIRMAEEKTMSVEKADNELNSKEEAPAGGASAVRFEIKKWNAVTMWSWDICADTCAICRNSLNEPSIEYQVFVKLIFLAGRLKIF